MPITKHENETKRNDKGTKRENTKPPRSLQPSRRRPDCKIHRHAQALFEKVSPTTHIHVTVRCLATVKRNIHTRILASPGSAFAFPTALPRPQSTSRRRRHRRAWRRIIARRRREGSPRKRRRRTRRRRRRRRNERRRKIFEEDSDSQSEARFRRAAATSHP